jgi:outer membrane lipoprotein-sorting protein
MDALFVFFLFCLAFTGGFWVGYIWKASLAAKVQADLASDKKALEDKLASFEKVV